MFAVIPLSEWKPDMSLVWLLYLALAFMLLMIVVGWLSSHREQDQPEARQEARKATKKNRRKPA